MQPVNLLSKANTTNSPVNQQYALKTQDTRRNLQTCLAFLRTFFSLSPDIFYELTVIYLTCTYKIDSHGLAGTYSRLSKRQNKGRKKAGVSGALPRKAQIRWERVGVRLSPACPKQMNRPRASARRWWRRYGFAR